MRKTYRYILLIIVTLVVQQVKAQYVEINETSVIADNWIQMIIDKYGHWGEYGSAVTGPMQELKQNNHLLIYMHTII